LPTNASPEVICLDKDFHGRTTEYYNSASYDLNILTFIERNSEIYLAFDFGKEFEQKFLVVND
jgi:hypothetical protein